MNEAMRRFAVIRPHIEDGVALTAAALAADIPVRTAQRWLALFRTFGLQGLERQKRSDAETRKLQRELAQGARSCIFRLLLEHKQNKMTVHT